MLHSLVAALAHEKQVSHPEAEALLRLRSDPASKAAVVAIDKANKDAKAAALALNSDMAKRLGMDLEEAAALVATLAADRLLCDWLTRRIQLTLASGEPPADDEHPVNG